MLFYNGLLILDTLKILLMINTFQNLVAERAAERTNSPPSFAHLNFFSKKIAKLLTSAKPEKTTLLHQLSSQETIGQLLLGLFDEEEADAFPLQTAWLKTIVIEMAEQMELVKKITKRAKKDPKKFLNNEALPEHSSGYFHELKHPFEIRIDPLTIGIFLEDKDFRCAVKNSPYVAGSVVRPQNPELYGITYFINKNKLASEHDPAPEDVVFHEIMHCFFDRFISKYLYDLSVEDPDKADDNQLKDLFFSQEHGECFASLTDDKIFSHLSAKYYLSSFDEPQQYLDMRPKEWSDAVLTTIDHFRDEVFATLSFLCLQPISDFGRNELMGLLCGVRLDEFGKAANLCANELLLPAYHKLLYAKQSQFNHLMNQCGFVPWGSILWDRDLPEIFNEAGVVFKKLNAYLVKNKRASTYVSSQMNFMLKLLIRKFKQYFYFHPHPLVGLNPSLIKAIETGIMTHVAKYPFMPEPFRESLDQLRALMNICTEK